MHLRSPDLEAPRKKQVAAQLRNSQAASVATRTARAAPERLSAGSEFRTKEQFLETGPSESYRAENLHVEIL